MRLKNGKTLALLILAAGFGLRLIYLLQTKNVPVYYHPTLDSAFFTQWGNFKRQVGWLDAAAPFREPIYAYLIGLVYYAFRESLVIIRLVQCALAGLTCMLLYSTASRIYGRFAGILAGLLLTLYVPAIFFAVEINDTTLVVFLLALSAYLLVRAGSSRPYSGSALSGLVLGLAVLTKFTVVAALPAWLLHAVFSREVRLRKAALLLVLGFIIPPLTYQTFMVKGDQRPLFPLRSAWHAYLGSGSAGGTVVRPLHEISLVGKDGAYRAFAAGDRIEGQRDAMRFARIETGEPISSVDAAKHWRGRALEDFASDPVQYLRTYFTKLGILLGPSEPPSNFDSRFLSGYSMLLRTHVFSFAVIVPLGLLGFVVLCRRSSLFASTFIWFFAGLSSVYLVSDADKMIVIPFLTIYASAMVAHIVSGLRNLRTARSLAYAGLAVAIGLGLLLLPRSEMDRTENLVLLGDIYAEEAIFDRAEEAYEEAIRLAPDKAYAYVSLARLYANSGRTQGGIDVLEGAMDEDIGHPRLAIELASLLVVDQRPDEALELITQVENTYPYEPNLHQIKGVSLLAKEQVAEAAEELEKEVSYVSGGFITYSALGRAKLALEEYDDASRYLESALALNPYNSPVAMQLADAYTRLDQHLKACDILSRILSVDPGNMRVKFKFANCLYRAERFSDAVKQFDELHKYDPNNADILVNLGTVYAEMDSLDRAVETWQKALVVDPDNDMARENLRTARE
jgi:tetratricopeptide (TPR) repeat protein